MANIGELVKKYREQHNLSMDAFAEKCGVSKAYISMIEKGVSSRGKPINLTQDMMSALVRGMDDDFDIIFEQLDKDQSIMINTNSRDDKQLERLMAYLVALNPDYKDTVEKIICNKRLLEYVKRLASLPEEYQEETFKSIDYQIFLERKNGKDNSGSSKVG